MCTLPNTNTAPENRGSCLFATIFQGRAVSFAECNSSSKKQTERTMATESIFCESDSTKKKGEHPGIAIKKTSSPSSTQYP